MNITDEQLDEVGQVADILDNLLAASAMKLPPEKKLQYTLGNLRELSARLKSIVVSVSGDDPWGD